MANAWALSKHSLKLRQILRIVDFSVFLGVVLLVHVRGRQRAFANKALENEALMRFSTRLIKLVARASELTKGVTPASSSETKTVMTTKLRPVADGIAAVAYAFHPLVKENCETAHPADFLCDSGVAESCCDALDIYSSFSTSIVMTMDGMTPGTDASSKVIEEYKCSQHLAIFSLLNVCGYRSRSFRRKAQTLRKLVVWQIVN